MTYTTEVFADAGRQYGRILADQVADYVERRVELALALERDRYEELINGLIRACEALSERIDRLEGTELQVHSIRTDVLA